MIHQRPLLIPVLAMVLGLVVNDQTGFTVPFMLVVASGVALFLSSFIVSRIPFIIFLFLFFALWGCHALSVWTNPAYPSDSIRSAVSQTSIIMEGVVKSRPVVSDGRTSFLLNSENLVLEAKMQPVSGNVMVYVASGECSVARGDRIRIAAHLSGPRLLGIPGEFDYPRYLRFKSVAATAQVSDSSRILLVRGRVDDLFLRKFDDMAAGLRVFIWSQEKDPRVASVLSALLVGDQKQIPKDLNDAYTRAGVNHILSISGFHIGIIAYGMTLLLLLIFTRSSFLALHFNLRRLVLLSSLPLMVVYLFMTGAAPATARAVIMLVAIVFALCLERETDGINTLLLAASVLLLLHPPTLFDVSFQLSFLALWGIMVVTPTVQRWSMRFRQRPVQQLLMFIVASAAASAFTAIPVLYVFHQTSLNGMLANFIIVPLLGYGAVLFGFAGLLFSYISTFAAILFLTPAVWLTKLSNLFVTLFATLPVLNSHAVTALDVGLFLLWICVATFLSTMRLKRFFCSLIPVVAIVVHLCNAPAVDGRLHVTMLSVGQGESILLRLPGGENYLVDGGGYLHENGKDFGERTVAPALLKLGVNKLDGLILTHAHPDHLGGLPFIAETMPVATVWETGDGAADNLYHRFQQAIIRRHIPLRQLSAGMKLRLSPDIELQVLSPPVSAASGFHDDQDMNERSLVFRLVYKNFSMLFTADAGFDTEYRMLTSGMDMKATVLKVGHHGSRYSTSEQFLKKVSPSIALVSAGFGNRFGLPAADTLRLLQKNNVMVYRTDLDGTLELETDGEAVKVSSPYKLRINQQ